MRFRTPNTWRYGRKTETVERDGGSGGNAGRATDASRPGEAAVAGGTGADVRRPGTGVGGGEGFRGEGGGGGQLAATVVASARDAGLRRDYFRGIVRGRAVAGGEFPVLGRAGNRAGRIRRGKERGEDCRLALQGESEIITNANQELAS